MVAVGFRRDVRYPYVLRPFACYVPLACVLCLWAWYEGTLAMPLWPALLVLGMVCWTCLEYLLHRFVLHSRFEGAAGQEVRVPSHLRHHHHPLHEPDITAPVAGSFPMVLVMLGLFRALLGDWAAAALLMTGTIAGYLYYEAVHFAVHRGPRRRLVRRWQRANHLFHHSQDTERCFGVTSPLWDWVFGTHRVNPGVRS